MSYQYLLEYQKIGGLGYLRKKERFFLDSISKVRDHIRALHLSNCLFTGLKLFRQPKKSTLTWNAGWEEIELPVFKEYS